jgi:hypothetical protein
VAGAESAFFATMARQISIGICCSMAWFFCGPRVEFAHLSISVDCGVF